MLLLVLMEPLTVLIGMCLSQYNKVYYDDYDCCYLQTPEFVAVSAGIQEDGVSMDGQSV